VLEQLSEAHRKGHTSHTTDMMDTGEMSAISETEGMDPHASQLREVKKLIECVEVFRDRRKHRRKKERKKPHPSERISVLN
jgi:hypothetical protein